MIDKATAKQYVKRPFALSSLGAGAKDAVLLTFDDGPHPEVTPAVLRLLRRHTARAVFFVVGARVERAPHLLRTILDEGHVIGNHSFSHPMEHQPWVVPYYQDLVRCQQRVEGLTGRAPKLFRPPQGKLSLSSILAPRMLGLRTMLWSIDSGDWKLWDKDEGTARAAARALADQLRGRETLHEIILLHDDHPNVVPVLEELLPELTARGCDLSGALGRLGGGAAN